MVFSPFLVEGIASGREPRRRRKSRRTRAVMRVVFQGVVVALGVAWLGWSGWAGNDAVGRVLSYQACAPNNFAGRGVLPQLEALSVNATRISLDRPG